MERALTAAASLFLDAVLGEKALTPHPVVIMGKGIGALEKKIRSALPKTPEAEIAGGGLTAVCLTAGSFYSARLFIKMMSRLHPVTGTAAKILLGWKCLAMRGLMEESEAVRKKLISGTLEEAREQVSRIVGRDTAELTRDGVSRAAVETVAENFSDGVIAPLFYYCIGGAPLALTYKAVNTMDSMLGYKNESYLYFGRIPAKLDDAANYLPSRISALLLIAAAAITGEDPAEALKVWRRDRRKHESPNSAQTEAAMAGALKIWLGGPASYFGELHEKPVLGAEGRVCEPDDIRRANRLLAVGSILGLTVFSFFVVAAESLRDNSSIN